MRPFACSSPCVTFTYVRMYESLRAKRQVSVHANSSKLSQNTAPERPERKATPRGKQLLMNPPQAFASHLAEKSEIQHCQACYNKVTCKAVSVETHDGGCASAAPWRCFRHDLMNDAHGDEPHACALTSTAHKYRYSTVTVSSGTVYSISNLSTLAW